MVVFILGVLTGVFLSIIGVNIAIVIFWIKVVLDGDWGF